MQTLCRRKEFEELAAAVHGLNPLKKIIAEFEGNEVISNLSRDYELYGMVLNLLL